MLLATDLTVLCARYYNIARCLFDPACIDSASKVAQVSRLLLVPSWAGLKPVVLTELRHLL
jgi:hypothetical protein